MALNANKVPSRKSNTNPLEAGTYPTRLVSIIDLGLQPQKAFQGKDKEPVRKFATTYEFADEFMKDEDGQDLIDKPRFLSEILPFYSLSQDRAKSTIRYKALDPNEVHEGDWPKLIGTPCMVTVVINPGDGGKVYENIGNVSLMRQKDADKAPPLVNESFVFDLDEPDMDAWKLIPEWLQKIVKGNLEYAGSKLEKLLGSGQHDSKPKQERPATGKLALKVVPKEAPAEEDEPPY